MGNTITMERVTSLYYYMRHGLKLEQLNEEITNLTMIDVMLIIIFIIFVVSLIILLFVSKKVVWDEWQVTGIRKIY